MSSSDARIGRMKAGVRPGRRAFLASALSALALSACGDGGFRPMYGTVGVGGPGLEDKLAKVEVAPIPGRVGQRIRNELIFQNTGGGAQQEPAYRLEIALRESLTSTLVRMDGESESQIYALDASFRLINIADKKVVLEGSSFGRAGFERFTSIFANVRAKEDAENRAARTVAGELKSRLAAYLAGAA